MCFDCEKIAGPYQDKRKKGKKKINCIIIRRKFLVIIQIKEESYFRDIKKLKELSVLSKGYRYYEGDKILKENQMLKKGNHIIQYRGTLKGGLNRTIVLIKDTQIQIDIPDNTLTEEIMKIIGEWLNTDGNLIDIFEMHSNFSNEYLLDRNDILWNGRNNFKF
jgi:hypothetical protein